MLAYVRARCCTCYNIYNITYAYNIACVQWTMLGKASAILPRPTCATTRLHRILFLCVAELQRSVVVYCTVILLMLYEYNTHMQQAMLRCFEQINR